MAVARVKTRPKQGPEIKAQEKANLSQKGKGPEVGPDGVELFERRAGGGEVVVTFPRPMGVFFEQKAAVAGVRVIVADGVAKNVARNALREGCTCQNTPDVAPTIVSTAYALRNLQHCGPPWT